MNIVQRSAFEAELTQARTLLAQGALATAFAHLERAHVIGQAHVLPHVYSHWLMLTVEVRRRRPLAVLGQVARMLLGGLGSAVGVVPTGNTGGSDISMFKRLPIEPGLQGIIEGRAPENASDTDRPGPTSR